MSGDYEPRSMAAVTCSMHECCQAAMSHREATDGADRCCIYDNLIVHVEQIAVLAKAVVLPLPLLSHIATHQVPPAGTPAQLRVKTIWYSMYALSMSHDMIATCHAQCSVKRAAALWLCHHESVLSLAWC